MALKDIRLLYFERPDLSPFLVHLTKNTKADDGFTAFNNLNHILKCGKLWGSDKRKGFIKGPNPATCFMDIPLSSLKYVLNKSNTDPDFPHYEPYGIIFSKTYAYKMGARPVLYLSDVEIDQIQIPTDQLWRVVRFEGVLDDSIGWLHEREWRSPNNFRLPQEPLAILVKNLADAQQLSSRINRYPEKYKSIPQSILPLTVLCQGLPYMD